MNQIGEVLDTDKGKCREIHLTEMFSLLKSDMRKFMSWGAFGKTFGFSHNNSSKSYVYYIRMRVSGYHHKGYVFIFLNGSDLFDVYLTNFEGKIKDRTPEMGIYNDQLIDWIDEKVERISDYVR